MTWYFDIQRRFTATGIQILFQSLQVEQLRVLSLFEKPVKPVYSAATLWHLCQHICLFCGRRDKGFVCSVEHAVASILRCQQWVS